MIVLPINSVINPLLYDNTIKNFFESGLRASRTSISSLRIGALVRNLSFSRRYRAKAGRDYKMEPIDVERSVNVNNNPRSLTGNLFQEGTTQNDDDLDQKACPDAGEQEMIINDV